MSSFYPLTFKENLHTALWGTESWEISGHTSSPSTVANGEFAGQTLSALAATYGRAFMGTKAPSETDFPLLFKVIDAQRRLSVQVHPNERTRALIGGEPKTEMWRVLGGTGPIFAGLQPGTTPQTVAENVENGRFEETLVRHDAREGLTLFIPGGLVHAIGENVLIYEVQQSSNTTYRLYDWGRVGADGKPRQLHVAAALEAIDYTLGVPVPCRELDTPFFKFDQEVISGERVYIAPKDKFLSIFSEREGNILLSPGETTVVGPGHYLLTEFTCPTGTVPER